MDIRVTERVEWQSAISEDEKQIAVKGLPQRLGMNEKNRFRLEVSHNDRQYVLSIGDTTAVWLKHCREAGEAYLRDFDDLYADLSKSLDEFDCVSAAITDKL